MSTASPYIYHTHPISRTLTLVTPKCMFGHLCNHRVVSWPLFHIISGLKLYVSCSGMTYCLYNVSGWFTIPVWAKVSLLGYPRFGGLLRQIGCERTVHSGIIFIFKLTQLLGCSRYLWYHESIGTITLQSQHTVLHRLHLASRSSREVDIPVAVQHSEFERFVLKVVAAIRLHSPSQHYSKS